jgi:hypothetical protein
VTDQWTPSGPLTPPDDWGSTCGCAPGGGPSSADNVVITGSPGAITSAPGGKPLWSLVLNDGTPAADFRIDRYSDAGLLVDSPMGISRATGVVTFNDPVMLDGDPLEPLEAATKAYVDANAGGIPDAPNDGTSYVRNSAAWAPFGGPYLPLAGGTVVNLSVASVLTVLGSNSVVLNAVLGGQQRGILAQTNGVNRWQMILADGTAETGSNTGSNFTLNPISDGNIVLPTALAFNRATSLGTVAADPTAALGIATKQYVDAHGGGGVSVTVGATPPASPAVGALWWDTNGGQLYVWYNDGNSSQWVAASNSGAGPYLPLTGGALTGPLILSADPTAALGAVTKQYSDTKLPKLGVTDGSDASAGQIGEVISAVNTAGVAAPNGTPVNIASIPLTPGDWDVFADGYLQFSVSAAGNGGHVSISNLAATLPLVAALNQSRATYTGTILSACAAPRPCRVSLAAAATYYLVVQSSFASGTCTVTGAIWARRAR